MGRVANRMVWANGFTNDKRHHSNKEPYKKKCSRCNQEIWLTPVKSGWKALDTSGKPHECAKKKTKSKRKSRQERAYQSKCKFCEEPIMMKMVGDKWTPLNDNKRHRCKSK